MQRFEMKLTLMKHQAADVKFMEKRKRILDFSDAGTGKTPKHIIDISNRRKKRGSGKILILAPRSLLESAWAIDFRKWAPHLKLSIARADNREEAFAVDADVYLTNVDATNWLAKKPKKFFDQFEVVTIDESTAYKHRTSTRSRNLKKIIKYFDVRRALSGTPTSNGICDIWNQVYLIDNGKRLGKSFFSFRKAVCDIEIDDNNRPQYVDKPNIEIAVASLIEDITIRNKFEDCVDIPANHRFAVPFSLSNKHREMYDELEKLRILTHKGQKASAKNGGALYQKLLQCASGAIYVDPENDSSDYTLLDEDRYDLILDLVEARDHSVCFFNWRHQKEQLIKVAKARDVSFEVIDGSTSDKDRERIRFEYQAGKYQVLFGNAQSMGHGLTFTKGKRTIFSSPTPNLEHFLQGYKRIYRITQTEKTETVMVIAPNTIDEYVWSQCLKKDVKQSDFLAYLEN
jgi:hypothetical protein